MSHAMFQNIILTLSEELKAKLVHTKLLTYVYHVSSYHNIFAHVFLWELCEQSRNSKAIFVLMENDFPKCLCISQCLVWAGNANQWKIDHMVNGK